MSKRNIGLDALKVVAMLMIVCLHWLLKGNALESSNQLYNFSWLIYLFCVGAVNMYVLISGYFLYDKQMNLKKILKLEKQILFYSILAFLIYILLGNTVSKMDIIHSFFPTISKTYWFNTIYILLFMLSPFLNILISNLNKKQHFLLLLLLIVFFSLFDLVFPSNFLLATTCSYEIIWFVCLYFTATFIKKYFDDIKGKKYLIIYIIISIMLCIGVLLSESLLNKFNLSNSINNHLYNYNSIFVFISSVSLFIYFKGLKIKSKDLSKCISYLSPLTFGVYLIHDNFLTVRMLYNSFFKSINYTNYGMFRFLFVLILEVFVIFGSCIIIEHFRRKLFDYIEKTNAYIKFSNFIDSKIEKLKKLLKDSKISVLWH